MKVKVSGYVSGYVSTVVDLTDKEMEKVNEIFELIDSFDIDVEDGYEALWGVLPKDTSSIMLSKLDWSDIEDLEVA